MYNFEVKAPTSRFLVFVCSEVKMCFDKTSQILNSYIAFVCGRYANFDHIVRCYCEQQIVQYQGHNRHQKVDFFEAEHHF